MVDKLTAEQIREFEDTFRLFDDDEDGVVSSDEAIIIMRNHGVSITDKQLENLIKEHTAFGKDAAQVDFPEFLAMMGTCLDEKPPIEVEHESLIEAFKVFDPYNNGRITSRELRTIVMTLGEAMDGTLVDNLIRVADIDRNGLIDYTEFVTTLLRGELTVPNQRT